MIVISGALVLVALVLLVVGMVGSELGYVYASIAVSLVSLGALVVGVLQRRDEPETEHAEVAASQEVSVAPADGLDQGARSAQEVLVVSGRPRYHREGCRYLVGKEPVAVDLDEAREDGFTPCGGCRPDGVAGTPAQPRATSRKLLAPVPPAGPATTSLPDLTAASAGPPAGVEAVARPGSVVVIPDRGRFHRVECRYVRGIATAEVLSRTAATRQGYDACGVCKP